MTLRRVAPLAVALACCAGVALAQTGTVSRAVSAGEDARGFVRDEFVNPAALSATRPGAWPFVSGAWSAPRLQPLGEPSLAQRLETSARSNVMPGIAGVRFGLAPQGRVSAAGLAVAVQHGGGTFDAETATRTTSTPSGDIVETQRSRAVSSIDAAWIGIGVRVGSRVSAGVSVGAERFRDHLRADSEIDEPDADGAPLGSLQRIRRTRDIVLESTVAPRLDYAVHADITRGLTAGVSYRAPVTADWKKARFDTTRVAEVYFPVTQLFRVSSAGGGDSLTGVPMHLQPSVQYTLAATRPTWPLEAHLRLTRVRTVRLTVLAARPFLNAPMTVLELPARWWSLVDAEAERRLGRGVRVSAGWRQSLRAMWSVDGSAVDNERLAGPRVAVAAERHGWRLRLGAEWLAAPDASREPVHLAPAVAPRRVGERNILMAVERF